MEIGKIYFISFSDYSQLVVRYKDEDASTFIFYDYVHCFNEMAIYSKDPKDCYSTKRNIIEIRPATLPEKHILIRFEIENTKLSMVEKERTKIVDVIKFKDVSVRLKKALYFYMKNNEVDYIDEVDADLILKKHRNFGVLSYNQLKELQSELNK